MNCVTLRCQVLSPTKLILSLTLSLTLSSVAGSFDFWEVENSGTQIMQNTAMVWQKFWNKPVAIYTTPIETFNTNSSKHLQMN